ncbi:hypothetical protein [Aquihabitans sp. McL0605]|uniref:hypothetical protein n=1 Tax=Aquihabitans sp. McL0605 TaxID=3415671 RepID=UPI003CEE833A
MLVLAVMLSGLLAGCGSGSSGAASSGAASGGPAAPKGSPGGAPLADGLKVPAGAALAGSLFWEPFSASIGGSTEADTWTALMTIDGDPFAAWDDLAAQIRALDGAPAMPGSADSCTWTYAGGTFPDDAGPKSGDEILAALAVRDQRPRGAIGVACSAQAPAGGPKATSAFSMSLQTDDRVPPTLALVRGPTLGPVGEASSYLTSLVRQTQNSPDPAAIPGPEPVPAGAAAWLPDPVPQPTAKPGQQFGSEVNCFESTGYAKTVLPAGATLVGDGWDNGSTSVVAAEDVDAAFADLLAQFQVGPSGVAGDTVDSTFHLPSGETFRSIEHSVPAGGGSCSALASPDGRFIRISRHAD